MGAELGATTFVFPFTQHTYEYLVSTNRKEIADFALSYSDNLCADANSESAYDSIIDINLSELEPHINGPFTPDLATPISEFADLVRRNNCLIKLV